jgi:elongation factor G
VEPQSETVWHQADKYHVPRIAFINKMDRVGADFYGTIRMMREKLATVPVPIQIPIGAESDFTGVVDLIAWKALIWEEEDYGSTWRWGGVPDSIAADAEKHRESLLEFVAERNETLMEKYLSGDQLTEADIKGALRDAVLRREAVPVMCGSALKNKGIQPLLDAVIDYFPSPLEVPPVEGRDPKTGEPVSRRCEEKGPLSALAFKVIMDEGRKLTYVRIYSGVLNVGDSVYNTGKGEKEKTARIFKMHANKKQRVESARAGEIVAVMGLKITATGDTLCSEEDQILLESIEVYKSVISMAVEPEKVSDEEKLNAALEKIADEDPTFQYRCDEDSGQIVISGMGELHLDILANKINRLYKVPIRTGKPQVVYRETITASAEAEGIFDRELQDSRQYGHVFIRLEPLKRGAGVVFESVVAPEKIPPDFIPEIEKAFYDATLSGTIAGYPVVDIKGTLFDGSYRDGASTELAYIMALNTAMKHAIENGKPVLLEPIMEVEIVTPAEFLGEVISDINARKGKVDSIHDRGATRIITAHVPLKNMFGYSTAIRSASQGRATFTMKFSKFEKQE